MLVDVGTSSIHINTLCLVGLWPEILLCWEEGNWHWFSPLCGYGSKPWYLLIYLGFFSHLPPASSGSLLLTHSQVGSCGCPETCPETCLRPVAVLLHKEIHLWCAHFWCDQVHEIIHWIRMPRKFTTWGRGILKFRHLVLRKKKKCSGTSPSVTNVLMGNRLLLV